MNNIGNILKRLREERGLKGNDVVEKLKALGIEISVKTLYGYESGRNSTNADMFLALCQIYKCQNIMEVFSDSVDDVLFTNKEWEMIERYRTLDNFGRERIDYELARELERVTQIREMETKSHDKDERIIDLEERLVPRRIFSYHGKIASAGTSYGFDDITSGTIEVPLEIADENADYTIGVSGDSMEPTYYDGDIVYVQKTTHLNIGDVGIFQKDNCIYIKEVGENGLISHNSKYKPMTDGGDVVCLGKVLGKVEE